jgi:hypothetical protein
MEAAQAVRGGKTLDWFQDECGGSWARVYIGGTQRKTLGNVGHAHVARPSRLQQPTIWERPEPASCDTFIKDSVKRSVFLCSKKISLAPRLNSANRGACAHHDVSCCVESSRVETSERGGGGGGARVWHFSSHSLTKWCNTPPYMLVYISCNFPCGTKLSSHLLPLCSQKLRLHVTWAYTHGL